MYVLSSLNTNFALFLSFVHNLGISLVIVKITCF